MGEAISLTLGEAGYVVGQSSAAINRAVDRGIIKVRLQRRGKSRLRKVGAAELRYLAVANLVEKDLTPTARRKVYEAIRRLPAGMQRVDFGVMGFVLTDIDQRIAERLRRLEQVKALVGETMNGDPVLRGTNVPVHAVAALARGQTVPEIMEDHPGLTPAQIDAAVEYAGIYPKPGRPLPTRSFKRMLGDLAAAGTWDLGNDPEPAPRSTP